MTQKNKEMKKIWRWFVIGFSIIFGLVLSVASILKGFDTLLAFGMGWILIGAGIREIKEHEIK